MAAAAPPTDEHPPAFLGSAPDATTNGHGADDAAPSAKAPLNPGLSESAAVQQARAMGVAGPPTFASKEEERTYLKGRLATAFRIFGKYGFDEGVAGHITVRVRLPRRLSSAFCAAQQQC